MPFGLVFGAVFFAALAFWTTTGGLGASLAAVRWIGSVIACLGIGLAAGLVLRQPWARWAGAIFALILSLAGTILVAGRGQATDFAVFLGAGTTLVLLLVPSTGSPRRGLPPEARPWRRSGRVLGWLTFGAIVLLVAMGVPAVRRLPSAPASEAERDSGTAAAAPAPTPARLEWLDYGSGLERAKSTGKPVFIDFYASWCGPCKMMERKTFRDAEVKRKLSEIVAVRVNSEETEPRSGGRGADVADQFNVTGYPTLVVLDSEGREVSRRTGFVPPEEFTAWLARSIEKAGVRLGASPQMRS